MFPDDPSQPDGYDPVQQPDPGGLGPAPSRVSPFGRYASALGKGMAQGMANQSPIGRAIWNAAASQPPKVQGESPAMQSAGNQAQTQALNSVLGGEGGGPPIVPQAPMAPPSTPADSGVKVPNLVQAPVAQASSSGDMNSSWGQSSPKSAITAALFAPQQQNPQNAAKGTLVTQPTLARIGEKGPEAVVPLTPRAGNKLQPDLLEGRLKPPSVPGVRYSRYKSFSNMNPLR